MKTGYKLIQIVFGNVALQWGTKHTVMQGLCPGSEQTVHREAFQNTLTLLRSLWPWSSSSGSEMCFISFVDRHCCCGRRSGALLSTDLTLTQPTRTDESRICELLKAVHRSAGGTAVGSLPGWPGPIPGETKLLGDCSGIGNSGRGLVGATSVF